MKSDVGLTKDKKGVVHKRKNMKVCQSRDLEESVYQWYVQHRSVKVNVRRVDILDAKKKLSESLGIKRAVQDIIHNKVVQAESAR